MSRYRSFAAKGLSCLAVSMLCATPALSADAVSVLCVDISSTNPASRVLELAATPVNQKYYSLAGSHRNSAGLVVGSAVGTAQVGATELITTVNASNVAGSTMEATLYQFNFNTATLIGPFKSITQKSSDGMITSLSGQAKLVGCSDPATVFSGSSDSTCPDNDGDGRTTCFAAGGLDCNDFDNSVYPGATEACDSKDNDCDGVVDDGCSAINKDADGDGRNSVAYGGDDCDDTNNKIYPGAPELCTDSKDNDCDNAVNEDCPVSLDADGDGHASTSSGGDDCNDLDNKIYLGAPELCTDNKDNDCDNVVNENCNTDTDNDGYTSKASGGDDCDDNDNKSYPGAPEICTDTKDNDCDNKVNEGCPATFTDNRNGTLTQTGSNLVWQQKRYEPTGLVNWHGYTSYCDDLTLAGATNWRLPTRSELEGIIDLTRIDDPATDAKEPKMSPLFTNAKAGKYWSNTDKDTNTSTMLPTTSLVYVVDFTDGRLTFNATQSTLLYALCVHN